MAGGFRILFFHAALAAAAAWENPAHADMNFHSAGEVSFDWAGWESLHAPPGFPPDETLPEPKHLAAQAVFSSAHARAGGQVRIHTQTAIPGGPWIGVLVIDLDLTNATGSASWIERNGEVIGFQGVPLVSEFEIHQVEFEGEQGALHATFRLMFRDRFKPQYRVLANGLILTLPTPRQMEGAGELQSHAINHGCGGAHFIYVDNPGPVYAPAPPPSSGGGGCDGDSSGGCDGGEAVGDAASGCGSAASGGCGGGDCGGGGCGDCAGDAVASAPGRGGYCPWRSRQPPWARLLGSAFTHLPHAGIFLFLLLLRRRRKQQRPASCKAGRCGGTEAAV
ncbi:MAG: hypothetical protein GMKNLPBB_02405 [Myxococcota bacterium]|nr:hypothetical protein [Myxococcota bacterium]